MKTNRFFYFYDRIVDIADKINRLRAQQKDAKTSSVDRDAMFSVIKEAGFHLFNDVMDRIREDAVSGILKMDILIIAAFYGERAFRYDFSSFVGNAQILHAVVSKLAPADLDTLVKKAALGDVFKITPENCNKALQFAESNLTISRSERTALQRVLYNSGWLKEPVKVVLSIVPSVEGNTDGKEKKQEKAA